MNKPHHTRERNWNGAEVVPPSAVSSKFATSLRSETPTGSVHRDSNYYLAGGYKEIPLGTSAEMPAPMYVREKRGDSSTRRRCSLIRRFWSMCSWVYIQAFALFGTLFFIFLIIVMVRVYIKYTEFTSRFGKWLDNPVDAVVDEMENFFNGTAGKAKELIDNAAGDLREGAEDAKKHAEEAAKKAKNKADELDVEIKNVGKELEQMIEDKFKNLGEGTKEKVEDIVPSRKREVEMESRIWPDTVTVDPIASITVMATSTTPGMTVISLAHRDVPFTSEGTRRCPIPKISPFSWLKAHLTEDNLGNKLRIPGSSIISKSCSWMNIGSNLWLYLYVGGITLAAFALLSIVIWGLVQYADLSTKVGLVDKGVKEILGKVKEEVGKVGVEGGRHNVTRMESSGSRLEIPWLYRVLGKMIMMVI